MFKREENHRLVLDGIYTKEELKTMRDNLASWRDQETYKDRMNWNDYNYWGECIRLIDTHLAILEDLI